MPSIRPCVLPRLDSRSPRCKWTEYLLPQNQEFVPEPRILAQAKAFFSQAISHEHKAGKERCTTVAEMFNSLEQQYGQIITEDEMRLETQLINARKHTTDTIEQHITKFKALFSAVMAQQDARYKYSNRKTQPILYRFSRIRFNRRRTMGRTRPISRRILVQHDTRTTLRRNPATQTDYCAHILPRTLKKSTTNAVEGNVYWTKNTSKNPTANTSNRRQSQNRGRYDKSNNFGSRPDNSNNRPREK